MTELVLGTKKGLFTLVGDRESGFQVTTRAFSGDPVDYAIKDPRTGRLLACTSSPFYGPKLFYTADGDGEWSQARGVSLPRGGDAALERVWVITLGEQDGLLYAGGDPGVLFESRDGGETWELNRALYEHPTRGDWTAGAGGMCLHSIVPWPGDPDRLLVAISAGGVWLTEDGGRSWRPGNQGLHARYLPEEGQADAIDFCVHHIERAPHRPERLFMQFHGGVFRSDDAGESWVNIADGLVSDFGFPLAIDPDDPDSAYVIPLEGPMDRVTPEGRVRVFETRDGGRSWAARGEGLPQDHAYLNVLRLAFARQGRGSALGLYFGTTSGQVFGSEDGGASWFSVIEQLPTIYSITVAETG